MWPLALHLAKLVSKLDIPGLGSWLRSRVMDFLTDLLQQVRVGRHTSPTLILDVGIPQGCVLSPMLFALFTHDCAPIRSSNSTIKSGDDTPVGGLISDNDETAYRLEVEHPAEWWSLTPLRQRRWSLASAEQRRTPTSPSGKWSSSECLNS